MGGMVALKLIAEHPDRVLSGTLGGVGWLPEGSVLQRVWAHMRSVSSRGVSELALTENELKAIRIPVLILVGDRDPMRRMYAVPLQKVRNDWQVVEIQGAGHLNCIFKGGGGRGGGRGRGGGGGEGGGGRGGEEGRGGEGKRGEREGGEGGGGERGGGREGEGGKGGGRGEGDRGGGRGEGGGGEGRREGGGGGVGGEGEGGRGGGDGGG